MARKSPHAVTPQQNTSLLPPLLVPLKVAASLLGCSPRTVRNIVYRGELHPIKKGLGRSWLFDPQELRSFAHKLLRGAAVS